MTKSLTLSESDKIRWLFLFLY